MTRWTSDELNRIGAADELELASARPDGALRKSQDHLGRPGGDDLYVRSMYGRTGGWFPATQERQQGHTRAGGVDNDVTFADADPPSTIRSTPPTVTSTTATASGSSAAS